MNDNDSKLNSLLMIFILLALSLGTLAAVVTVSAQETPTDCTALVQQAVTVAQAACPDLERNTACFGSAGVSAVGFDGAPLSAFAAPGDRVSVNEIAQLTVTGAGDTADTYGVAILSLGANVLGEQAVTAVVFGDVTLTNRVEPGMVVELVTLDGTVNATANIRTAPTTDADILEFLDAGDAVIIDGRSSGSDWLRMRYGEGTAWVFAASVTLAGEISALAVVEVEGGAAFSSPMQRFDITAGGASPCTGIPPSGILFQTPPETSANFAINGVELTLFDTVVVRQNPDTGALRMTTVDGGVRVLNTSSEEKPAVAPGFTLETLAGEALPEEPPRNSYDDTRDLPLALLPRQVNFSFPESAFYFVRECLTRTDDGFEDAPVAADSAILFSVSVLLPDEAAARAARESGVIALTLDDQPVRLWAQSGPFAVPSESGTEYYIDWLYYVPAQAVGTYALALSASGTDSALDGEVTCTVRVE